MSETQNSMKYNGIKCSKNKERYTKINHSNGGKRILIEIRRRPKLMKRYIKL